MYGRDRERGPADLGASMDISALVRNGSADIEVTEFVFESAMAPAGLENEGEGGNGPARDAVSLVSCMSAGDQ